MKTAIHISLIGILGCVYCLSVQAGELVYQPVNPAFGGNPLNGNWLLTNAQLQDNTSEHIDDSGTTEKTALDRFNDMLERLVLNRMSTVMIDQFTTVDDEGNYTFQAGTYTIGDFQVDVVDAGDVLTVTTTDIATGQTTEFVIDQSGSDL